MPKQTFKKCCWLISLSKSAAQTASLIEVLVSTPDADSQCAKKLKNIAENFAKNAISEHEFMHRSKIEADKHVDPKLHAEAIELLTHVLEGNKALSVLKNAEADRPDEDYDQKELEIGRKSELEHTTNAEVADIIAKDHLDEDPAYYSKLQKMEAPSTGAS
jgi:hypothetical protein